MITKTFTGHNTKEFVSYADYIIKCKNFNNILADMILDAYENGVDPIQFKDYLMTMMNFTVLDMVLNTDYEFNDMIARRDEGNFNLPDSEVLACAAHEAWKKVTNK